MHVVGVRALRWGSNSEVASWRSWRSWSREAEGKQKIRLQGDISVADLRLRLVPLRVLILPHGCTATTENIQTAPLSSVTGAQLSYAERLRNRISMAQLSVSMTMKDIEGVEYVPVDEK